ncbi:HlyD family efflux transporter periplasmic adaptor subunit [Calothrix rhizosoleniae]|uniref:HlyD family efflux transporter periplasmic adaptor subunit n=1 Tax=Calothrix rhizosoleniae TaxID=888997 RepID=UPI000B4A4EB9|nr:HlyD family efflux transporter periplasmic adaptor subunit [Calothrix rhizosoleniae]
MIKINGNQNQSIQDTISQNSQKVQSRPKSQNQFSEQSVVLRQSPIWSRAIMMSLVGLACFGMIWASIAKIEQVVPATGQLKPEGAVKEVQAPVNGLVKQVHVKDGDKVKKGDLLVTFDSIATNAELKSLQKVSNFLIQENNIYRKLMNSASGIAAELEFVRGKLPQETAFLLKNRAALVKENELLRSQLRLSTTGIGLGTDETQLLKTAKKELESRSAVARLEIEQIKKRLAQNEIQLNDAKNSLLINTEIFSKLKILAEEGAIAELQFLQQKQQLATRKAEVERLTAEKQRLEYDIQQGKQELSNTFAASSKTILENIGNNKKRIAEIDSQLTKIVVENDKKLAEIRSQIAQTKLNIEYQELRSPVDGTVFDLQAYPGFVANVSQLDLLKIVPKDTLIAEVFITNKDIGFVRDEMIVDVRIDSFPFSEFGDIKGKVISVGSDALPPDETHKFYRFPAKIRLDNQKLDVKGKKISLQSGMSISANIKVREERTVMSILTDQFTQQVESLKQVR